MSLEQVFMMLIGGSCGMLGWFARELFNAVNRLKEDINRLEVRMGTDYVRYDRLQDALKPIKDTLEEIKLSVAHKADRILSP